MRENSPKKHSKKKSPDELFPLESAAAFSLRATATADELFPITGLTDAQLRQIALDKSPAGTPWIPKPAAGRWSTVATLRGLADRREARAAAATPKLDTLSFPSMDSCEGLTGITKTIQQLAKGKNCTAFRGPRIYLLPLLQWIFREGAAGETTNWSEHNEKLDAILKQIEIDTKLHELRKAREIEAELRDLSAIYFGHLRRLKLELPRDLEMRPKAYIKEKMENRHREIVNQITALIGQKIEDTHPQPELQVKK